MKHFTSGTEYVVCDTCKDAFASHKCGDKDMCCKCYVSAGNPPADWHHGCMEAYREKDHERAR